MITKYFFYLSLFVISLCPNSCKERDEIDPCKGMSEFKGDFQIFTGFRHISGEDYLPKDFPGGGSNSFWRFQADTGINRNIYFKSVEGYDSIKWLLQGEANYRSGNPGLYVDFSSFKGTIDVTMIGYRIPNLECFPNEKSVDTIVKKITLLEFDQSLIFGKWKGAFNDALSDSFEIDIVYENGKVMMKNFPNQAANTDLPQYAIGYKQICATYDNSTYLYPDNLNRTYQYGFIQGEISKNNLLNIDCRYKPYGNMDTAFSYNTFTAYRIN